MPTTSTFTNPDGRRMTVRVSDLYRLGATIWTSQRGDTTPAWELADVYAVAADGTEIYIGRVWVTIERVWVNPSEPCDVVAYIVNDMYGARLGHGSRRVPTFDSAVKKIVDFAFSEYADALRVFTA